MDLNGALHLLVKITKSIHRIADSSYSASGSGWISSFGTYQARERSSGKRSLYYHAMSVIQCALLVCRTAIRRKVLKHPKLQLQLLRVVSVIFRRYFF